jgi:hypothetical protein
MRDRRNALLWAIGWWIVRRQIKRRAAHAVAGAAAGAAARRSQLRAVVAAVALVGALAAAFVVWRKLFARADTASIEPVVHPETAEIDGVARVPGTQAATGAQN